MFFSLSAGRQEAEGCCPFLPFLSIFLFQAIFSISREGRQQAKQQRASLEANPPACRLDYFQNNAKCSVCHACLPASQYIYTSIFKNVLLPFSASLMPPLLFGHFQWHGRQALLAFFREVFFFLFPSFFQVAGVRFSAVTRPAALLPSASPRLIHPCLFRPKAAFSR